ncbi:hypothetical protein G9A89_013791 [Geosiphon pyriformis]|nr:hypothetical protein G9A89_013791 [Geosiphon pyriformis]
MARYLSFFLFINFFSALASFSLFIHSAIAEKTWTIKVGDNGLKFNPETLVVGPKDHIVFYFQNGPHRIVQSTEKGSCNATEDGFKSAVLNTADTFDLQVGENPRKLYYYCSVGKHCEKGMTGTILVASDNNDGVPTVEVKSSSSTTFSHGFYRAVGMGVEIKKVRVYPTTGFYFI